MPATERRIRDRARTRLRPAKILGANGAFLGDATILDRSADGARLRLFSPATLAGRVTLFDESDSLLWEARLVWAKGGEVGLSFASTPRALEPAETARIAGRYYAVAG